jgi:hypothetical protein
MGNGSIVPRQERFDTKHALCCMPVHVIRFGRKKVAAQGWVSLTHPTDHPPPKDLLSLGRGRDICRSEVTSSAT